MPNNDQTIDVHVIQQSEQLFNYSTAIHTAIGFLIMVLLALLQVNYQEKKETPFENHRAIMVLFTVAAVIYTASFLSAIILIRNHLDTNSLPILKHIPLISGTLACGLLLLVLIPSFGYSVLALCALLYVRILLGLYVQILQLIFCAATLAIEEVAIDSILLIFQLIYQLYNMIFHVWFPLIPHVLCQGAAQVLNVVLNWSDYVFQSVFRRDLTAQQGADDDGSGDGEGEGGPRVSSNV